MPELTEIKSEIQLLVEGNDQRNFFEAFIDHLSLENIQIQNFGGVRELRDFLDGLVSATGFRQIVQSLGIVRDAETSAGSAFQSVQSSLMNKVTKCEVFKGSLKTFFLVSLRYPISPPPIRPSKTAQCAKL